MGKALRHLLTFWKQKDREPEDVSHHFRGHRCISECELFIKDKPLLRAIVLEWLSRNPGIKPIPEMFSALDIHTHLPLWEVLKELAAEKVIMLSTRYQMLSSDWQSHVGLTVNTWLKCTAFEQAHAEREASDASD